MPIKGLSEQRRMPRLGKIHLGVKKQAASGTEYPSATDYFVCPPEVQEVCGEKPTELNILIPVEDEEYWASQYYRCYSRTRGLVCKGDGETCNRMVDKKSGDMANRDREELIEVKDRVGHRLIHLREIGAPEIIIQNQERLDKEIYILLDKAMGSALGPVSSV